MDRRDESRERPQLQFANDVIKVLIHEIRFSIQQVMLVPLMGKTACSYRRLLMHSFKRLSCFIEMPKQCLLAQIQKFRLLLDY